MALRELKAELVLPDGELRVIRLANPGLIFHSRGGRLPRPSMAGSRQAGPFRRKPQSRMRRYSISLEVLRVVNCG